MVFDVMHVANTESRKKEVGEPIESALISSRKLSKPEAMVLRGKLGFADSFMHGRLGVIGFEEVGGACLRQDCCHR